MSKQPTQPPTTLNKDPSQKPENSARKKSGKDGEKSTGSVKSKKVKNTQKEVQQQQPQHEHEKDNASQFSEHGHIDQIPPQIQQLEQHHLQQLPSEHMQIQQQYQQLATQSQPIQSMLGPRVCVHHQMQFAFFCETCEEPICQQCTMLGPHNNQLHRINRMNDAYKLRTNKIQEQIKVNLLGKREQILAQIHRIEYRIEEIKYVKTIVERDARAEYSSILERLKSSEGSKLALLHHEIAELQKDLDQINDVGSMYYDLTQVEDLCPFLLRSRQIYENIEYLVAKPFKVNIDVYPYDLPRELTELRLQLQKAVIQILSIINYQDFKNEIIWKLLNDKKKDEDLLKNELEKQASEEINEWARLVDKFSLELKKYQLICNFCACPMDKDNVNRKCPLNKLDSQRKLIILQFSLLIEDRIYCQEQPPADSVGNEKHYFARPIGEDG